MTAEVAILNKLGVALAADSTVTITTSNGDKTYNTTNKLFTLSKYHPVGMMIWNATDFNTVPFELIIKEFRESLGRDSKNHLGDYADLFIRHLRARAHVGKAEQLVNFRSLLGDYCRSLRRDFFGVCRELQIDVPIGATLSGDARNVFNEILDSFEEKVISEGKNKNLRGVSARQLSSAYSGVADDAITRVLNPIRPTLAQKGQLISLLHQAALSNLLTDNFTGLVFAGYGNKQYYPSIIEHRTDGMFANRLKLSNRRTAEVVRENPAMMAPFARREAANLFMEGVDHSYQDEIDNSIHDLLVGMADVSAKYFGASNARKIDRFRSRLRQLAANHALALRSLRYKEVKRVLDAVEFLDKSEMALLAENLVSLTALKQKISLETETVGGPIDVAFISKNDGFIWIKRKHYFDGKLNPFFSINI